MPTTTYWYCPKCTIGYELGFDRPPVHCGVPMEKHTRQVPAVAPDPHPHTQSEHAEGEVYYHPMMDRDCLLPD